MLYVRVMDRLPGSPPSTIVDVVHHDVWSSSGRHTSPSSAVMDSCGDHALWACSRCFEIAATDVAVRSSASLGCVAYVLRFLVVLGVDEAILMRFWFWAAWLCSVLDSVLKSLRSVARNGSRHECNMVKKCVCTCLDYHVMYADMIRNARL